MINKNSPYLIAIQTYPYLSAVLYKNGEIVCGIDNERLEHFSHQEMASAAIHYLCSSSGILPEKIGLFIHIGWETEFSGKSLQESLKRIDIPLTRYSLIQTTPDLSSAFYTMKQYDEEDGVFFYFSTKCISLYEFKDEEVTKLELDLDKNGGIQRFLKGVYDFINVDNLYLIESFPYGKIDVYNRLKRLFSFDPNGRVYLLEDALEFYKVNYDHEHKFDWYLAIKKITEDIFIHLINYIKYITHRNTIYLSGDISQLLSSVKLKNILPVNIKIDNIPSESASLGGIEYYEWQKIRHFDKTEKQVLSEIAESIFDKIRIQKTEYLSTLFRHQNDPILLAFKEAFSKCKKTELTFKIEDITLNTEENISWVTFLFFIFGHDENNFPYIVNHKGVIYFKREISGWENKSIEFTVFRNDPILTVELTNNCNFKCIMCDQSKELKRKTGFMDEELFDKIIGDLSSFPVSTITPFWLGESTLHPDFSKFINLAFKGNKENNKFFNMTLNTNGSLLKREISDVILGCSGLKDQNISSFLRIHFSIDASSANTYHKIHANNSFDTTIKNIKYFLQKRKELELEYPKVTLAFIIMPQNKNEAGDFLEMCKNILDEVKSDYTLTYDWPAYNKDAIYFRRLDSDNQKQSESLHREVLENIGLIEKKSEENKERIIVTDSILKEDISPEPTFVRRPCPGLWKTPIINWDGEVTVCCFDVNMTLKVGNIKEQSLKDIWDSTKINYWRMCHIRGEFDKIPLCAQCANLNAPTMKNADFIRYLLRRGMGSEIQAFLERVGAGI